MGEKKDIFAFFLFGFELMRFNHGKAEYEINAKHCMESVTRRYGINTGCWMESSRRKMHLW